VCALRAHELARWLLSEGDFDVFLYVGGAVEATVPANSAYLGTVTGFGVPFTLLSGVDLSEGAPEAPVFFGTKYTDPIIDRLPVNIDPVDVVDEGFPADIADTDEKSPEQ